MRNSPFESRRSRLLIFGGVALLSVATFASPPQQVQEPALPATAPAAQTSQPEFKLRVEKNVVVVRAIVRDANGRPVPKLRKEDFRLFDNGKAQAIDQFSMESLPLSPATPPAAGKPSEEKPAPPSAPVAPQNYQALFFDDLVSESSDLNRARDAAERYVAATLTPADRVGVFTTSGEVVLDFTANREQLQATLLRLRPRPRYKEEGHYALLNIAPAARPSLRLTEEQILTGEAVLRSLEHVVRRMASLPGQRSVVMLSPGVYFGKEFLYEQLRYCELAESALRLGVVINAVNLRGLYTIIPGGDASTGFTPADNSGLQGLAEVAKYTYPDIPLYDITSITGGQFFHDDNDLEKGLRRVGTLADVYYVLAFSPRNLKLDGHYHQLKVTLAKGRGLTVQARRGYFAPGKRVVPEQVTKSEIHEALFSQGLIQDLPLNVQIQVGKVEGQNAEIGVQSQLDIRNLPFERQGGRYVDNVTFAVALFDRDGKYISGTQKNFALALKDTTLAEMQKSGLTYKAHVLVKAGAYTVRVVVRDSQGGKMAASSKTVAASL